jgi:hypothetical protein
MLFFNPAIFTDMAGFVKTFTPFSLRSIDFIPFINYDFLMNVGAYPPGDLPRDRNHVIASCVVLGKERQQ